MPFEPVKGVKRVMAAPTVSTCAVVVAVAVSLPLTVKLTVLVVAATALFESFAANTTLAAPCDVVAVPVTAPVVASSVKPVGSVPVLTE